MPCQSPLSRVMWQEAAHLIAAGHDDVLWFRHDTALLSHQGVLGMAGQPIGGEKPIVLLHTEGLS